KVCGPKDRQNIRHCYPPRGLYGGTKVAHVSTAVAQMEPLSGETAKANRTVLIVDDDDASRNAIQTLLELDGFQVVTAVDGQEGIEQLRGGLVPMAILLDLCMPRMDGFQFRSLQTGEPRFAAIPVVV